MFCTHIRNSFNKSCRSFSPGRNPRPSRRRPLAHYSFRQAGTVILLQPCTLRTTAAPLLNLRTLTLAPGSTTGFLNWLKFLESVDTALSTVPSRYTHQCPATTPSSVCSIHKHPASASSTYGKLRCISSAAHTRTL